MDVFLEEAADGDVPSLLSRLAIARPLRGSTTEELLTEAAELARLGIRYVAVRRQQVRLIGEHTIHEILEDHGLSVSCLGFAGGFTGALGWSFEKAIYDVQRALEMAAELCADSVVVVPGGRGLHTYRHAERIVRDGLQRCARLVDCGGPKLLVPTDTVLAGTRDCFHPHPCLLEWLRKLQAKCIRPMIVVRGQSGSIRLPRGWRQSLVEGGRIRICHRCDSYSRNARLLEGILSFLYRGNPDEQFGSEFLIKRS